MNGQDEVHSRAKRQATKMGEVKTELISVADTDAVGWGIWFRCADTDSVGWRIWFRCRCRFRGLGNFVPLQMQIQGF